MAPAKPSLRSRKRQTRLQFQSLPISSPDKALYSTSVQDRLANVRYEGAKSNPSSTATFFTRSKNDSLPTPEPSSQPRRYGLRSSSPLSSPPASSPNLESHPPPTPRAEDEDEDLIIPSSKRRRVSPKFGRSVTNPQTPAGRSTRSSTKLSPTLNPSQSSYYIEATLLSENRSAHASSDSIGSPETSGDEEDVLISKPTSRKKIPRSVAKDHFVVDDDEVEFLSSDEDSVAFRPKQMPRRNKSSFEFIAGEEEETITPDNAHSPWSHSKSHNSSKHRRRSKREQEELDDDLKDLQDSSHEDSVKRRRTRGGPVMSQRDERRQQLNQLRRQRAGRKIPRLRDSEDEILEDDSEEFDIDNITRSPRLLEDQYRGANSSTDDQADEPNFIDIPDNEDDFIVDDSDEGPRGRPHPDIPLAFTSYASRKPKELFVHIIEWLVKNKLAPAFSRDDEVFELSWGRVNDQIKAQAGSRLISSAWNAEFKHVILARPYMNVSMVTDVDEEAFMNCDACNRTNHPARYEFKFTGQAYNQDTLEAIEFSDDEDENNDASDDISYDQEGHTLAPQSTRFYLGRFCAANAEMGHKLTHWKHHLNESLLEYLEEQGVLSTGAIIEREKLNKKKREKQAEAIVDSMEATGIIAKLWQDLQDDLDDARFGMEGHEAKGGRRNAARIGKVRVSRDNGTIEEWSEGGRRKIIFQNDSEGE